MYPCHLYFSNIRIMYISYMCTGLVFLFYVSVNWVCLTKIFLLRLWFHSSFFLHPNPSAICPLTYRINSKLKIVDYLWHVPCRWNKLSAVKRLTVSIRKDLGEIIKRMFSINTHVNVWHCKVKHGLPVTAWPNNSHKRYSRHGFKILFKWLEQVETLNIFLLYFYSVSCQCL